MLEMRTPLIRTLDSCSPEGFCNLKEVSTVCKSIVFPVRFWWSDGSRMLVSRIWISFSIELFSDCIWCNTVYNVASQLALTIIALCLPSWCVQVHYKKTMLFSKHITSIILWKWFRQHTRVSHIGRPLSVFLYSISSWARWRWVSSDNFWL